jgi:two-component system cell cycle response regulator
MGPGFDWKKYMVIEPSRAKDNHGRGIAQARAMSFDRLSYNDTGNQVVGFVSKTSQIEW